MIIFEVLKKYLSVFAEKQEVKQDNSSFLNFVRFYEHPRNLQGRGVNNSGMKENLGRIPSVPQSLERICYCPLDKRGAARRRRSNFVFLLARLRDQANLFGRDARMTPSQGQVLDAFFRCRPTKPAAVQPALTRRHPCRRAGQLAAAAPPRNYVRRTTLLYSIISLIVQH